MGTNEHAILPLSQGKAQKLKISDAEHADNAALFHDSGLDIFLNQVNHSFVMDVPAEQIHQQVMIERVEIFTQVHNEIFPLLCLPHLRMLVPGSYRTLP